MTSNRSAVSVFVILNSAMYALLLLSEWLMPGAARLNAYVIGGIGAGCCATFGAKLMRPAS